MVGPAAIGITSFVTAKGDFTINDASSASFIKKINTSATYDGYNVNGPHLLIQGVSLSGLLDIYSTLPVVIRGSKIRTAGYWTIFARPGSGPLYVLYSDIGGTDATSTGQSGDIIRTGNDGHNVIVRNHMSYGENGFTIGSQNDQILENFIEHFNCTNGAHCDGLQTPGNNDGMVIARNKILLDSDETGCINISPWGGGTAQYVTIDSNYFAGGSYTFYGGAGTGTVSNHLVVTNNVFGYDFFPNIGTYGAVAYWENGPGNVWSGNADTNGKAVLP